MTSSWTADELDAIGAADAMVAAASATTTLRLRPLDD
jgi:hypothetical protein